MKLKFLMALAAAVSLAGLGSLSDTASAQHPGWGGGNGGYGGGYGGGWGGGNSGGNSWGGGNSGGNTNNSGAGTWSNQPAHNYNHNFQKSGSGNSSKYPLNNSHEPFKTYKSGVNKNSYTHHQGNIKKATFSKPNIWSNKLWGGRGWRHDYWHRWYGPVFWPYFFGDYFCYGFWPDYCYDVYWGYGPDVILWGAFWPSPGEYGYDEAAAYDAADAGEIYAPYRTPSPAANKQFENKQAEAAAAAETCAGFAPGVSDLPIQKLEGIIDATEEQRTALEDLKAAVAQASDILEKACPSEAPLTPVARLDAMQHRLQAMEEANGGVKGPFVRLYGLLTDEQKQRLKAVSKPSSKPRMARARDVNVAGLCSSQAGFTSVPTDQIARTITLTSAQEQELEKLKAASAKASDDLKNSCPSSIPETLDGRLGVAQQRVTALIGAVDTVRPAVADFYASLTDEQKAALSVQPAPQNRG